jgi:hypothetical protein
MDVLKDLFKQPYWIIALVSGVALVALTCVTVDKDYHWSTHAPGALWLAVVGIVLLALSSVSFGFTLLPKRQSGVSALEGLDPQRVQSCDGAL